MLIRLLEMFGLKHRKAEAGSSLVVQAMMNKVSGTHGGLEHRKALRFELMRDTAESFLRQVVENWGSDQFDLLSARLHAAATLQKAEAAIEDAWSWYVGVIDQSIPELRRMICEAIHPIALEFGDEGLAEQDRLLGNAEEAFRRTMILMGRDIRETQTDS